MTIDKAIEILQDILRYVKPGDPPDEHDALKLSIEALKAVKSARANNYWTPIPTMPGETK